MLSLTSDRLLYCCTLFCSLFVVSFFSCTSIDFFVHTFSWLVRSLVCSFVCAFLFHYYCSRCVMFFKFHYEILIAATLLLSLFSSTLFSVSFSYAESCWLHHSLEIANEKEKKFGESFFFLSFFLAWLKVFCLLDFQSI